MTAKKKVRILSTLRTEKKMFHPPSLYVLLSTQFSENAPFYRYIFVEKNLSSLVYQMIKLFFMSLISKIDPETGSLSNKGQCFFSRDFFGQPVASSKKCP